MLDRGSKVSFPRTGFFAVAQIDCAAAITSVNLSLTEGQFFLLKSMLAFWLCRTELLPFDNDAHDAPAQLQAIYYEVDLHAHPI